MRSGPVYVVRPKYIFKHPFNKYDFTSPTNRETQNQELTDYFNYGFNEDTMSIYGKLVKRFIQIIEHNKFLEEFEKSSELMRLNDQMCMDFGGFCKFHDPSVVDNQTSENFHDGEKLMEYFVMMCLTSVARKKSEYPIIDFIKHMYKKEDDPEGDQDTTLYEIIQQIGRNLEKKYEETLRIVTERHNAAKAPKKAQPKENREREKEREKDRQREERHKSQSRPSKQKQKSKKRSESESDSSDSSESEVSKKKKDRKSRSKERTHKKDRKKQHRKKDRSHRSKSRDHHKSKKVKKEKHRRSKSRDHKKRHH